MVTEIGRGAEAIIYFDGSVVKDRICKSYRLPQIDEKLRKSRTRREAKVLDRLARIGVPAPRLISTDDTKTIRMSFISGQKVRDALDELNCAILCSDIGRKVALLHNNGIIHGDLTTSNMILVDGSGDVAFIDFGLSFFSDKVEDKAVDLHLMKQAFESKHHRIWERCFDSVVKSYAAAASGSDAVIERFVRVEERGRNKHKG